MRRVTTYPGLTHMAGIYRDRRTMPSRAGEIETVAIENLRLRRIATPTQEQVDAEVRYLRSANGERT